MPHFRTRPSTFSISLAPSGRARCRACKGVVEKGAVRLVTHAFVRPGRGTRFVRHAGCVDAAFARVVLAAHGGSVVKVPVSGEMDSAAVEKVRVMLKDLAST